MASRGRAPVEFGAPVGQLHPVPRDRLVEVKRERLVETDQRAQAQHLVARQIPRKARLPGPLPGGFRHIRQRRRLPQRQRPRIRDTRKGLEGNTLTIRCGALQNRLFHQFALLHELRDKIRPHDMHYKSIWPHLAPLGWHHPSTFPHQNAPNFIISAPPPRNQYGFCGVIDLVATR